MSLKQQTNKTAKSRKARRHRLAKNRQNRASQPAGKIFYSQITNNGEVRSHFYETTFWDSWNKGTYIKPETMAAYPHLAPVKAKIVHMDDQ